jgi:hypothetical protein
MQNEKQVEAFDNWQDFLRALFEGSVWKRCQTREDESGHDFIIGPLIMKKDQKTWVCLSLCRNCGRLEESKIYDLMSSMTMQSENWMKQ